ncbi:bacterial regulatory protein, Fis family [Planomonospora sphaerica]|uniref:Bacterial regulatory protein, Fis family n=1 Tax=Planomonospora sphaerica TaxID=161355 RepID=A0A171DIT6_9ACTN|nr:helix-turn-helix domain-containing protein [Planomonospora sphaerica]GAT68791.1 bacterial regulatory protein, Fis family [Planomonospora sphaerica]
MPTPADPAGAISAIGDPARRARAAKAAAEDASRLYGELYRKAIKALVEAHGGNRSKAARELGISSQRVGQILGEDDASPSPAGAAYGEPALYFGDEDAADAALRDWALANQELIDRRDPLVRGARMAGLSPRQIRELTDLPLETIERLVAGDIAVAVEVELEVWEAAVEHFADLADAAATREAAYAYRSTGRALAGAIGMVVDGSGRAPALDPAMRGPQWEALSPQAKAELAMTLPVGGDVPETSGEHTLLSWDAWAALYCARLERGTDADTGPMAEAMRHCAAILRHIRIHAALPQEKG